MVALSTVTKAVVRTPMDKNNPTPLLGISLRAIHNLVSVLCPLLGQCTVSTPWSVYCIHSRVRTLYPRLGQCAVLTPWLFWPSCSDRYETVNTQDNQKKEGMS
ncbi:hypothetical protein Btru_019971 [Bulinus truncatus]|nr:hypothetical protein Btru_019971 [Bulinus truncatus]